MDARIPQAVQPLLQAYLQEVDRGFPGLVTAFYIHGSMALGAFNERLSDIDFIAVISRPCTTSDFERLSEIHRSLESEYPRCPLSGSYLQANDLGRLEETMPAHPYYHDAVLHPSGQHDINSVTWWVLKHRGITLLGPDAQTLNFDVDWPLLLRTMKENTNTYWAGFTTKPTRIAWLIGDYGIQWTVLGVLRQWYTFKENDITSKTGAGEYALAHLPSEWHRLIQEALNIRAKKAGSLYRFKILRAIEAWRFLRMAIRECNAL